MNDRIAKFNIFLPRLTEISFLIGLAFLPISKAITEIGIITGICAWILKKILIRENFFYLSRTTACYLLLLAAITLSLIQVPHDALPTGIKGLFKYLKFLGFFLAAGDTYNTPEKRYRLGLVFVASMLAVTCNGFFQLMTGTDLLRHYALEPGRIARMRSSMASPNHLATFLMFAAPMAIFIAKSPRTPKNQKWLYLSIAAIFVIALITTFSRAALFGFFIAVLLHLMWEKKFKTAGIVLALSGLALLPFEAVRNNFFGTLNFNDITIRERLHFWQVTWSMIQAHPWLGIGINMYTKKYMLFAPAGSTLQAYTHNSYLQLCAEIGVPGILLFLAPLSKIICPSGTAGVRASADAFYRFIRIPLLAFLIQSFADNNFFALQTAGLFWLFWGIYAGPDLTRIKAIDPTLTNSRGVSSKAI